MFIDEKLKHKLTKEQIDLLLENGGNRWRTDKHDRIYFNNIYELCGLKYHTYKTGNVQSAWFEHADGTITKISNNKFKKIAPTQSSKFYVDVMKNQFSSYYLNEDIFNLCVSKIEKILND